MSDPADEFPTSPAPGGSGGEPGEGESGGGGRSRSRRSGRSRSRSANDVAPDHPLPTWMRIGDAVALGVILLIFCGGLRSTGYATDPFARGMAWNGCALLGIWAAVGAWHGRFSGPTLRPARLLLAFMAVWCLCWGVQITPLPRGLVAALSADQAESVAALEKAGITPPAWMPLALSPGNAVRSWHQLVAATLFLAGALLLATRRRASMQLFQIVAVFAVIEGLIGLSGFLSGMDRTSGAIFNPDHHAAFIIMGLPVFFTRVVQLHRFSPAWSEQSVVGGTNPMILLYGIGMLAISAWLLTLSRGSVILSGGILLIWIGIELWGMWNDSRTGTGFEFSWSAFVLASLGVVVFCGGLAGMLLASGSVGGIIGRSLNMETAGVHRMEFWRATLEGLGRNPVTGIGPAGAEYIMNRFSRLPLEKAPVWSHNDYVQWIAETGIPAAVVCAAALGWFLFNLGRELVARLESFAWSTGLMQRAALAGVVASLAHAIVDFHLRIPLVGFEFLILLALAIGPGPLLVSRAMYARLWTLPSGVRQRLYGTAPADNEN